MIDRLSFESFYVNVITFLVDILFHNLVRVIQIIRLLVLCEDEVSILVVLDFVISLVLFGFMNIPVYKEQF